MHGVDLGEQVMLPNLPWMIGGGLLLGLIAILGWVFTTWLRIKHGYPLDGQWGQALLPKTDRESAERIKLLTSENAQLRAEVGSIKVFAHENSSLLIPFLNVRCRVSFTNVRSTEL